MLDPIYQIFSALRADAAGLSFAVQIWMKGIALSMLLGFVMAYWDRRALWIGWGMAIIVVSLFVVKGFWPEVPRGQIGTWAHLIFWPTALFGLWRASSESTPSHSVPMAYSIWKYWVTGVMCISLGLDAVVALKSLM